MGADLARFVASGKIELARRDVEMGDLVREAVDLVLPLVVLRKQVLVLDISEGLVVNVDASRMTVALERLLTNVVKLSASASRLVVTTRTHASRVVVTVTSSTLPANLSLEDLAVGFVAQLCEIEGGALLLTPGQLRVMLPHQSQ